MLAVTTDTPTPKGRSRLRARTETGDIGGENESEKCDGSTPGDCHCLTLLAVFHPCDRHTYDTRTRARARASVSKASSFTLFPRSILQKSARTDPRRVLDFILVLRRTVLRITRSPWSDNFRRKSQPRLDAILRRRFDVFRREETGSNVSRDKLRGRREGVSLTYRVPLERERSLGQTTRLSPPREFYGAPSALKFGARRLDSFQCKTRSITIFFKLLGDSRLNAETPSFSTSWLVYMTPTFERRSRGRDVRTSL